MYVRTVTFWQKDDFLIRNPRQNSRLYGTSSQNHSLNSILSIFLFSFSLYVPTYVYVINFDWHWLSVIQEAFNDCHENHEYTIHNGVYYVYSMYNQKLQM